MIRTEINHCFNGAKYAFIYIWFSRNYKVAYVGMTRGGVGTIGRANQHLSSKGTLRFRFNQHVGISINNSTDFVLYSFPLPTKYYFRSVETSYREAVEYLVQKILLTTSTISSSGIAIISKVRVNPRISNSEVKKVARRIAENFISSI